MFFSRRPGCTAALCGVSRVALITALLLFTFTSAVVVSVDAATVTSAACTDLTSVSQGSCASDTVVTFTGADLAGVDTVRIGSSPTEQKAITCVVIKATSVSLNCTLKLDSTAYAGMYPVSLLSSAEGQSIAAGSLAVGQLRAFSATSYGFANGWKKAQPAEGEVVTGMSADMIVSGEAWTVYGNFIAANKYKVLFYSDVEMGMIACNNGEEVIPSAVHAQTNSGFKNALVCNVTSEPGVMGMYTLLVQDASTGAFLPGSTGLYMITVTPPLPKITAISGACAADSRACVNGAELTFTGTNFNARQPAYNEISIVNTAAFADVTGVSRTATGLTCVVTAVSNTSLSCALAVDSNIAKDGSYAVYARVHVCTHKMLSEPVYIGNLMYGASYGASVAGLALGSIDMETGKQVVAGKTDGYVFTGGWLAVFGTFDASHKYHVDFYNVQRAGTGVPTCGGVVVTAYMINCTGVTQKLGNLGMYRVLVKDTTAGFYVPSVTTGLDPIMVFAPLPTFTAASGDCAADSRMCVTGAILSFTGINFVTDKKMDITFDHPGIHCVTNAVSSATSATCTLSIDAGVPAGEYPMYVAVQGCAMGMMTPPNAAGVLVLTEASKKSADRGGDAASAATPGWKATAVPSAGNDGSATAPKTNSNVAAIACAVIFGILTLVLAVGFIIAVCLFCRLRKQHGSRTSSESYAAAAELVGVAPRSEPYYGDKTV